MQAAIIGNRYHGAAQTPAREALNRLIGDGLIECREQRGFAVTPVSAADLLEITKTRCRLEEVGLRESIANRSAAWEEELVPARHRLAKMPRSGSSSGYEEKPGWEALHKAVHHALIGGCQSRWLIAFCEQLTDQLYRYRQLAVHRTYPNRHERVEHQAIVDAVLAGDADLAVQLLAKHYRETADIILADARLFRKPADWVAPDSNGAHGGVSTFSPHVNSTRSHEIPSGAEDSSSFWAKGFSTRAVGYPI